MRILLMTRSLLAILIAICFAANAQAAEKPALGRQAPDFSLKDLSGKTHSLNTYRGRITIVAFIATECPISNDYNGRMREIANEYSQRNVAFLGINSNFTESVEQIKAHAAKNNLGFTILKDAENKVADAYGAERTPEIFVLDEKGVLRYHGRVDNSRDVRRVNRRDLREALNELLAGKPVSVAEGKSFGCLIKRVQNSKEVLASAAQEKSFEPKIGTLKPVDFQKFKNSAQGKVLVINFWATWCGPCVAEFPEFVMLDKKYRDLGVKFVGISADEMTDLKTKVIPFIKEQRAMFDILIQDTDDPQEMIDAVNKDWPGTLPATFVFDKQGKPVFVKFGIIDREELVGVIEKALK